MEEIEYKNHYNHEEKFWWFKGHRKIMFNFLEKYLSKKKKLKIVDAGCGTGINITLLQKYGNVIGIDNSKIALDFCKKRGITNTILTKIEDTTLEEESVDLIICQGVLYHKDIDVKKTFIEFKRILKKNGKIIISTPAMKFLSHSIFSTIHDDNNHSERRYYLNDLKEIIKLQNLKILKISYFNFFLFFPILFSKILMKLQSKNFKNKQQSSLSSCNYLVNSLLTIILYFECYILKFINLPFGTTIVVVVEKNDL